MLPEWDHDVMKSRPLSKQFSLQPQVLIAVLHVYKDSHEMHHSSDETCMILLFCKLT